MYQDLEAFLLVGKLEPYFMQWNTLKMRDKGGEQVGGLFQFILMV